MTVVAEDLSKDCGLNVCADSIWVGGVPVWCSTVSRWGTTSVPLKTTRGWERLVELKFVTDLKLEILSSCSFLPHLEEPLGMSMLPPLEGHQEDRIIEPMQYWRPGGEHDRQKARREKDSGVETR